MDRLILTVDGLEYAEWTGVEVHRSLEEAAAAFSLTVAERASRLGPPMRIRPGSACTLAVDDGSLALPVINGYVDDQETHTGKESHETQVTGRSRTCDLVDCQTSGTDTLEFVAKQTKTGETTKAKQLAYTFNNITLLQLAIELGAPYGVTTTESPAGCSGAPFEIWKVEPDETVFETLERAARLRRVLLTDDAEGQLVIKQIADDYLSADAALTMPGNVEEATLRTSAAGLYSDYEVIGQQDGRKVDTYTQTSVRGKAADGTLSRYRLRRVCAEAQQTTTSATDRARWDAATRAGRASLYTCTVGSWRIETGGDLWVPGMVVAVLDTLNGVDADLLLIDVTLRYGADGTHADLTLAPLAGYLPESPAEYEARKKKKKVQGGIWPELVGGA